MSRVSLDEILEFPPAERVAVVQEIWESMAAKPETVPITAANAKSSNDDGSPFKRILMKARRGMR